MKWGPWSKRGAGGWCRLVAGWLAKIYDLRRHYCHCHRSLQPLILPSYFFLLRFFRISVPWPLFFLPTIVRLPSNRALSLSTVCNSFFRNWWFEVDSVTARLPLETPLALWRLVAVVRFANATRIDDLKLTSSRSDEALKERKEKRRKLEIQKHYHRLRPTTAIVSADIPKRVCAGRSGLWGFLEE